MNSIFLLLGSNLGNRQHYLQEAIRLIGVHISPVIKTSSIYETQSWGKTDAPDYLNQVVVLETVLPAQELLYKILDIELVLGRKREEKWGSRTVDIDILFYGDEIIDAESLQVPHPELHKRRFTLEPLAEIAPGLVHPVLKKTTLALKNELKDSLIVKKL
ncbi:MAG: 2-amino-4-hydroxy-6-hydroxymethyldihydropteridine diphosphokinase [Mucilaginibacter sp.]